MAKEIKLRNLSDADNDMLEELKALTGKGQNSQAVLQACYRLLRREKEIIELEEKNRELNRKVNSYEQNVKSMLIAQNNLADMLKSKKVSNEEF